LHFKKILDKLFRRKIFSDLHKIFVSFQSLAALFIFCLTMTLRDLLLGSDPLDDCLKDKVYLERTLTATIGQLADCRVELWNCTDQDHPSGMTSVSTF